MNKFFLQLGAVLSGLSVALGAFGAHAFKASLEAVDRVDTFETAARYQMYGGLALVLVGVLSGQFTHKFIRYAGNALLFGTLVFSGSLYLICATGITLWGAVAPIGGTSLMLGWLLLLMGITKK